MEIIKQRKLPYKGEIVNIGPITNGLLKLILDIVPTEDILSLDLDGAGKKKK